MSKDPAAQSGLEQVRAMLAAGLQPPMNEKLGIALIEADNGHALFEATPDGSAYNPMGSVHGGFVATILDSACGIAVHTALEPGYAYTTLELKVSYLRPLTDRSGRRCKAGAVSCRSEGALRSPKRRCMMAAASSARPQRQRCWSSKPGGEACKDALELTP